MPIEDIKDRPETDEKHQVGLVFYDKRESKVIGQKQTPIGYNGFADLLFEENKLTVIYRDIKNQILIEEVWEVGSDGSLIGKKIQQVTDHEDLKVHSGSLNDALK